MNEPTQPVAFEKPLLAARRISPRRKLLAALLAVVAGAFLLTLKHGAEQDHATVATAKAFTSAQREAMNAEIKKIMETRYGGQSDNREQSALVARVGTAIRTKLDPKSTKIPLQFHLLNEANSINIYGLSNGDVYITTALLNRMQTEGQLAAMLAHGAAHALAGDGVGPVATPAYALPLWQHSVEQERAADVLSLKLMSQAGYDPNALTAALTVLAKAYNTGADVAFFTTHPNETERLAAIASAITTLYPKGVPAVLSK
jgi:beta-barrel assembly-enhancing protease